MREVLGLFSSWLSPLPQTPEKGVCSDGFGTQRRGRRDGEERGDVDFFYCGFFFIYFFFFPPFLERVKGFPTSGQTGKCHRAGAAVRRTRRRSVGSWVRRCELCPLLEVVGPDPALVETTLVSAEKPKLCSSRNWGPHFLIFQGL